MDLQHPPESFGVFKPVGCVVITLRTPEDARAMSEGLLQAGFSSAELLLYSPADMLKQVDAETLNASIWAQFGQELRIAKAHRVLAANGCSFLVVQVPTDEKQTLVRGLVERLQAPTAQLYGHLVIEELTTSTASEVQFENAPDAPTDLPIDAALPPTRDATTP